MRIENFDPKIDINKVKSFVDGWKLETKENRGPFTQLVFSYTSPADDPVVDSCSVTIKLMLLQKTKGALYEYGIIATYRDDIHSYTYKNKFNRSSHSPEQLISVALAWASRKAFVISEHEYGDIMSEIWNNFDNINRNIPIKESKQINMGSMKLHEEFKLYENMWDEKLTEDAKTGMCDACKEKSFKATTAYGEYLCNECDDKYLDSEKGKLELFISMAIGNASASSYTPQEVYDAAISWGKHRDELPFALWKHYHTKSVDIAEALNESRSVADIEAEIARLQQELEQAKTAEKRASYGRSLPTTVWTWDIYLEPADKGTWTGIKNDLVFETKDKALDAAWELLNELDDEGELNGDPDDYYIEAIEIPLTGVSKETLRFSGLQHLI